MQSYARVTESSTKTARDSHHNRSMFYKILLIKIEWIQNDRSKRTLKRLWNRDREASRSLAISEWEWSMRFDLRSLMREETISLRSEMEDNVFCCDGDLKTDEVGDFFLVLLFSRRIMADLEVGDGIGNGNGDLFVAFHFIFTQCWREYFEFGN